MVKTKKILGIVLASMLAVASMVTSFAASNQDVLLALQEGATLSTGESVYPSVEDMQTAKNYLAEKNLSSSDLDAILADVETVQKTASTVSSFEELTKNADVTNAIKNSASVAGVTVSLDSGDIVITDSSGKTLLNVTKENVSKDKPDYSVVNGTSDNNSEENTSGSTTNGNFSSETTEDGSYTSGTTSSPAKTTEDGSSTSGTTSSSAKTTVSNLANTASTGAIKQTGAEVDFTNMAIVISSVVFMLAGAGFVAYKFNLLRD